MLLNYSMVQGPSWKICSCSAGQEIPCFYGTWIFITVRTKACLQNLSWASSVQISPSSSFIL